MSTPILYLIDASSFLFRAYYAIPKMSALDGTATNALYGFIRSLGKLESSFHPQYLAVVFDGQDNKESRKAIFAEYKSHRSPIPEDLPHQIELAKRYCKLAGLFSLCQNGVEADDTIGSLTKWWEKEHGTVIICSGDKDLCQLVNEKVSTLNLHKDDLTLDPAGVAAQFGVLPSQIPDYLALVGDSADNIPGIPGCGPKKAAALLQEYNSIENLILKLPQMKESALRKELEKAIHLLPIYKQLATLDVNLLIPKEQNLYLYPSFQPEKLQDFFSEMNFKSLITKQAAPIAPPCFDFEIIGPDFHFDLSLPLVIDCETTSLHPIDNKLVGIGLCQSKQKAYYLPFTPDCKEQLKSFLEQPSLKIIGHNIKFDMHVLAREGIFITPYFDTLIASYLLSPDERRHDLDTLAKLYFNIDKIPISSLIGKKGEISMKDLPITQVAAYCAEDVLVTYRLFEKLHSDLEKENLLSLFLTLEMPLTPILFSMEERGIYLDAQKLSLSGKEFEKEIEKIQEEIFAILPEKINLNSPKQLSTVLFDTLGLIPPKKADRSTRIEVLEELDHPIIPLLIRYRSIEKLRSTYVENMIEQICPLTGRIHTTFRQSAAATGRLISQDPNLQNIPIRSEDGQKIRSAFGPKEKDFVFISADYSQIELRILAHLSKDPSLIEAFSLDKDVHKQTASRIFHVAENEVTDAMRNMAKTVNFGIIYGQQAFGLSKIIKIPVSQAAKIIEEYFATYPKVAAFLEECKQKAHLKGYSETLLGRKRPLPEIHSKNSLLRQASERLAVNTPIQGLQADLMKLAMIRVMERLKKEKIEAFLLLQIHDELIFECPKAVAPLLSNLVQEEMERVYLLEVPLKVNLTIGKNWGEC